MLVSFQVSKLFILSVLLTHGNYFESWTVITQPFNQSILTLSHDPTEYLYFENFSDLFPTFVWGHLHGPHFPLGCICLLQYRVFHRVQWGYQLLPSMGCRETTCITHSILCGLQGNLCSGVWSTSLVTDLGACRVVSLAFPHSSLSQLLHSNFSLSHVIPEAPSTFLMVSALANSGPILEMPETGSVWCGGSHLSLFTKPTSAVLLHPPPLPHQDK